MWRNYNLGSSVHQPTALSLRPSLSFWMFWVSWCLAAITNKSHHQKEMERSRRPLSSETGQESFPFAKHPTEWRMFRTPLFRAGSLCMHGAQRNNDVLLCANFMQLQIIYPLNLTHGIFSDLAGTPWACRTWVWSLIALMHANDSTRCAYVEQRASLGNWHSNINDRSSKQALMSFKIIRQRKSLNFKNYNEW